jgi:hypothetical protein
VARVRKVDDVVADYATAYWGRPYRRREIRPFESAIELAGVIWSIEGETLVELHTLTEDGVGRLLVHDIGLLAPLKRMLRTRHLRIERPTPPPGDRPSRARPEAC